MSEQRHRPIQVTGKHTEQGRITHYRVKGGGFLDIETVFNLYYQGIDFEIKGKGSSPISRLAIYHYTVTDKDGNLHGCWTFRSIHDESQTNDIEELPEVDIPLK